MEPSRQDVGPDFQCDPGLLVVVYLSPSREVLGWYTLPSSHVTVLGWYTLPSSHVTVLGWYTLPSSHVTVLTCKLVRSFYAFRNSTRYPQHTLIFYVMYTCVRVRVRVRIVNPVTI